MAETASKKIALPRNLKVVVIEDPYKGVLRPWSEIEPGFKNGDPTALGVCVTLDDGFDYILSAIKDDVETTFSAEADERRLSLTGRLAVVRVRRGESNRLILLNGTHLAYGDESVDRRDETNVR